MSGEVCPVKLCPVKFCPGPANNTFTWNDAIVNTFKLVKKHNLNLTYRPSSG
jgi:hypothetical protein